MQDDRGSLRSKLKPARPDLVERAATVDDNDLSIILTAGKSTNVQLSDRGESSHLSVLEYNAVAPATSKDKSPRADRRENNIGYALIEDWLQPGIDVDHSSQRLPRLLDELGLFRRLGWNMSATRNER